MTKGLQGDITSIRSGKLGADLGLAVGVRARNIRHLHPELHHGSHQAGHTSRIQTLNPLVIVQTMTIHVRQSVKQYRRAIGRGKAG